MFSSNNKIFLLLPLVSFFLNIYPVPSIESENNFQQDTLSIYLIKQRWHTGIVFSVSDIDKNTWGEIEAFKDFKFVDVGWGDEEFYQHPDFDAGLAVKALFYPTPTTLRVEGFNFQIDKYIKISDLAIKIPITKTQLDILCSYISETYFKTEDDSVLIFDERYSGNIKFYKALGEYHVFNTCNRWVAEGLKKAGFKIKPSKIILAEDLFFEADKFGIVLKTYEN